MATPASPPLSVDDRDYYPLHEEDDVPETSRHKLESTDAFDILRVRFPDRFVMGDICIYWIPGNTKRFAAPDVFVAADFPDDREPRVYLMWRDPPVLFAAEVGSRSTFRVDTGPKPKTYERSVKAKEYLYYNPLRRDLRFWRMGSDGYQRVEPGPNGRWRSRELDLEFAVDADGYLRIFTLEGERLLNHLEEAQRRREAEGRADQEAQQRREAEGRANQEAQQRREAEGRANQEAQQRREAEGRADQEAQQRQMAESRAAEAEARALAERERRQQMEQELAALRAQLQERGS